MASESSFQNMCLDTLASSGSQRNDLCQIHCQEESSGKDVDGNPGYAGYDQARHEVGKR
jgi:hypothetical protein